MLGVTVAVYGGLFLEAGSIILGSVSILGGIMLTVGFMTPVTSLVVCFAVTILALVRSLSENQHSMDSVLFASFVATVAFAVALLGPGSISVDARLFGRREIVIPKRSMRSENQ